MNLITIDIIDAQSAIILKDEAVYILIGYNMDHLSVGPQIRLHPSHIQVTNF